MDAAVRQLVAKAIVANIVANIVPNDVRCNLDFDRRRRSVDLEPLSDAPSGDWLAELTVQC